MNQLNIQLVILTLFCGSCLGTEVGNPPEKPVNTDHSEIEIDFVSQSVQSNISGLNVSSDVKFDVAVIVVKDLRFRRCNQGENKAPRTRSFLAELLKKDLVDTSVKMPLGEYCRMDIRPKRGGEDSAFPDRPELKGNTMYARGSFKGTPLVIRYEGDDEISFFGKFEIDSSSDRLFISVDLGEWFTNVDLDQAELTDGQIILSDGDGASNTDLLEKLSANFEASISVGLDLNGNGVFDPIELRGEDGDD